VRLRRPPQHYCSKKRDQIHLADMIIVHPNMSEKIPITVAQGDGIGSQIGPRKFDGKQGFTLAQGQ
jgi:hypothetical protein